MCKKKNKKKKNKNKKNKSKKRKASSNLGAGYDYMDAPKKCNGSNELGAEYDESYYTSMDYPCSNEPDTCDDDYFTDMGYFTKPGALKVAGEPQSQTTPLSDPKPPMFNVVKHTCM